MLYRINAAEPEQRVKVKALIDKRNAERGKNSTRPDGADRRSHHSQMSKHGGILVTKTAPWAVSL